MQLYVAGARIAHYFPVSIPYHGSALNITVQSYAGLLDFGLTACRRVLSQEESHEMIGHLKAALREIEALPSVGEAVSGATTVLESNEPDKASKKRKSVAVIEPKAPRRPAAANKVAIRSNARAGSSKTD